MPPLRLISRQRFLQPFRGLCGIALFQHDDGHAFEHVRRVRGIAVIEEQLPGIAIAGQRLIRLADFPVDIADIVQHGAIGFPRRPLHVQAAAHHAQRAAIVTEPSQGATHGVEVAGLGKTIRSRG